MQGNLQTRVVVQPSRLFAMPKQDRGLSRIPLDHPQIPMEVMTPRLSRALESELQQIAPSLTVMKQAEDGVRTKPDLCVNLSLLLLNTYTRFLLR